MIIIRISVPISPQLGTTKRRDYRCLTSLQIVP